MKMHGLMDRCVERWRVRTPASHVADQVDTRGTSGGVEVVANVEAIGSKVIGPGIDAVAPRVMVDQDQIKLSG